MSGHKQNLHVLYISFKDQKNESLIRIRLTIEASKHEKMESFFVSRTLTKKINMLPMCNNKKRICEICETQKNDVNFLCNLKIKFDFF